jgi:hypothetical protein
VTPSEPSATAPSDPSAIDIPGFNDLPVDVRERLLKARRDPTKAEPIRIIKQAQTIRVAPPEKDDIFRTYPDVRIGWFDVHIVTIKKAASRRQYLVGENALKNPAVAQRGRAGVAILTTTTEGTAGVWVIHRPNIIAAQRSYPFDSTKWLCAQSAKQDWVIFAWNQELQVHQWQTIDLTGQPNEKPVWPAEHPLVLIDRAIASIFVDDPDFADFKYLAVGKSSE